MVVSEQAPHGFGNEEAYYGAHCRAKLSFEKLVADEAWYNTKNGTAGEACKVILFFLHISVRFLIRR